MSKYTTEALQAKAKETIRAKVSGDVRYLQLILTMSMRTGLDTKQVESKIEQLAKGEAV